MREKAEPFVTDHSYRLQMYAINSKLSCAYTNPWFSSPSKCTNYLSPRQEHLKQIASVTMVISGNSRLLMPNVPITLWYATPSLSYPDYALSFAVSQFQYYFNPLLIPNESLSFFCFCFSSVIYLFKALWFELLWLKLEPGEDSATSLVNRKVFLFKEKLLAHFMKSIQVD